MTYYTLPGDTLSSIAYKHWDEMGAPTLDDGVAWLCFVNPHLLEPDIATGTAYTIMGWQAGGLIYGEQPAG